MPRKNPSAKQHPTIHQKTNGIYSQSDNTISTSQNVMLKLFANTSSPNAMDQKQIAFILQDAKKISAEQYIGIVRRKLFAGNAVKWKLFVPGGP